MKCKCKLDIVITKRAKDCPVHPEAQPDLDQQIGLQEERENILFALGEHPDSPVDIPLRVAAIRDEGRAHFHSLTKLLEQLEKAKAEYDPKHLRTCDCHGCRRFRRAFTPNPDRPIYLQLDDEKKKVRDLAAETCRLSARLSSEIHRVDDLKDQVKVFEEKYVHQDLLLRCQDDLKEAVDLIDDAAAHGASGILDRLIPFLTKFGRRGKVKVQKKQPLALNCTKCGSTIHSDSFHSESCPNGYR